MSLSTDIVVVKDAVWVEGAAVRVTGGGCRQGGVTVAVMTEISLFSLVNVFRC